MAVAELSGSTAAAMTAGRKAFARSPGLFVGALVVIALLLIATFARTPFNPLAPDPDATLQAPSLTHLLGTDKNGSDLLARLIAGGRLDMALAIGGALVSALIGIPLGLLASSRGAAAARAMRALDVLQSFPLLVLAIVIVSLTGNDIKNVVIAIVLVNTPTFIRLVRSEALTIRETRFIEAARAVGCSPLRITFAHVLPNATATILAQLSLTVGNALITVAALSFLGIGISPPTPTWGGIIREGSLEVVSGHWWIALYPGLAIFAFVLSVNAIAEGLGSLLGPPE